MLIIFRLNRCHRLFCGIWWPWALKLTVSMKMFHLLSGSLRWQFRFVLDIMCHAFVKKPVWFGKSFSRSLNRWRSNCSSVICVLDTGSVMIKYINYMCVWKDQHTVFVLCAINSFLPISVVNWYASKPQSKHIFNENLFHEINSMKTKTVFFVSDRNKGIENKRKFSVSLKSGIIYTFVTNDEHFTNCLQKT